MKSVQRTLLSLGVALVTAWGLPLAVAPAGGGVLWEDRNPAGIAGSITANASVVSGSAVFVAGTTFTSDGEGRLVRAYAVQTGKLLWEDRHALSERLDRPTTIAAEGNAVFTAGVASVSSRLVCFVRAYDRRSGHVLWEDVLPPTASSSAWRVTVKNGRVFVTGHVDAISPDTGAAFLVRAYAARTGALLWQDQQGASGVFNAAGAVKVDGGRLFVIAASWDLAAGRGQSAIRAYNPATGALLWEHREVSTPGVAVSFSMLDAARGRVFVAGRLARAGEPNDALIVRAYGAVRGDLLWETERTAWGEYWGTPTSISAQGSRVFVAGDVYVSDPSGNASSDVIVAFHEAATGRMLWEDRIDVGPTDHAHEIVASSNRVFVTASVGMSMDGVAGSPLDTDFFVRAYEAQTGRIRWTDQIDAGAHDAALAIATQGVRVFAAGTLGTPSSEDGSSTTDFFVRGYDGR